MNPIKWLFSRLSPEEFEKRYVKKNRPTARRSRTRTRLGNAGYTRRIHEEPKYRRVMAKRSRRINRKYQ